MTRSAASVLLATGAAALLLTAATPDAEACSCVQPPPPLDALAQATAVFEARVQRIEVDAARLRMTAHLTVIRQWKGDLPEDVTVTTASQTSLCGFPFEVDNRVLLYVDGEGTDLSASMCSRSRPMEQAGEDLAALLDLPVSGPRRASAPPAGTGGTGGTGGTNTPPAAHGRGTATTAPASGGCGGCGGASLGGVAAVFVLAAPRRRARS